VGTLKEGLSGVRSRTSTPLRDATVNNAACSVVSEPVVDNLHALFKEMLGEVQFDSMG
jgi:hypothetical protein